jgi:hypothetical protein
MKKTVDYKLFINAEHDIIYANLAIPFKKYQDSINQQFAVYLAENWKKFNLLKSPPPITDPIPKPPVFDENTPKPKPQEIPVIKPQPPAPQPKPLPEEKPVPPPPAPQPIEQYPLKTVFFGTNISLKEVPKSTIHLTGISEKQVANYWLALAKLPYYGEWKSEALRLKDELHLNDWGLYLLVNKLFSIYFPQGNNNEQVIFSVFMLNQLSYRAKIGRTENELVLLAAFKQKAYGIFFILDKTKYWVLHSDRKIFSSVQTCEIDYEAAKNDMDLSVRTIPKFSVNVRTKTLLNKPIQYNENRIAFDNTYPLVEFSVYAEAALDETLWKSIETQLKPNISGKSETEAVNWLLHFVQNAFQYKTDEDQYGYEKWNFAEETIASQFSDCDDRAILFAQLVRRLLRLPVVLVSYPNHLATAVKFSNPAVVGDNVTVNGEKYLICDPTYTGADFGMSMPELLGTPVEITMLKQ